MSDIARIALRRVAASASLVAFATTVAIACAAEPRTSSSLEVTGRVAAPRTYSVDELASLPQRDVMLRDAHAAEASPATRPYRGVLLRELVEAARPIEADRFDLRRSIVVARATDGYVAVFSWAELFVGPSGDATIVAIASQGAALADDEGRIALVAAADRRSGPRHVRWLTSIEVRAIGP